MYFAVQSITNVSLLISAQINEFGSPISCQCYDLLIVVIFELFGKIHKQRCIHFSLIMFHLQ